MNSRIELLDCTLRDGAYIVDGKFGTAAIKGIIKKSQEANIDIVECGWLKNTKHEEGTTFFSIPEDIRNYIQDKQSRCTLVAMIDWDRYNVDVLPPCDNELLDAIRVVFPHEHYKEGIAVGKKITDKGYRVFFQAANTLAYDDEELRMLAEEINQTEAEALSIVDTFGAMYEEDLERIVGVLNSHLNRRIKLGFHSHNNQQLSFALSMHFVNLFEDVDRNIVVDASLCGMGRGAGNTTTELMASFLNRKKGGKYNLDIILDEIDVYMQLFLKKYKWGYSTPYFIAGELCCHVNNISYLLKNHRTTSKELHSIIESLPPNSRVKYDYDLLEEKYVENKLYYLDDSEALERMRSIFQNKAILLIAPGRSINDPENRRLINDYIDKKNPIVIGVNALQNDYHSDYLFIMNTARYEYTMEKYPKEFSSTPKIVLSNVKYEKNEKDMIICYNRVVERGWDYFDNAVITCLRLMGMIGANHIAIAGFDGFEGEFNKSYSDEYLPTIAAENYDMINNEVKDMIADYHKKYDVELEFITPSIFDI